MTAATVIDWVQKGTHGTLLGNYDVSEIFGEGAFAEVYWIFNDEFVGVIYPDKARMASCLIHKMDRDIQHRFNEMVKTIKPPVGKLRFKAKQGPEQSSPGGKPRLHLKSRLSSQPKPGIVKPRLHLKPK